MQLQCISTALGAHSSQNPSARCDALRGPRHLPAGGTRLQMRKQLAHQFVRQHRCSQLAVPRGRARTHALLQTHTRTQSHTAVLRTSSSASTAAASWPSPEAARAHAVLFTDTPSESHGQRISLHCSDCQVRTG